MAAVEIKVISGSPRADFQDTLLRYLTTNKTSVDIERVVGDSIRFIVTSKGPDTPAETVRIHKAVANAYVTVRARLNETFTAVVNPIK